MNVYNQMCKPVLLKYDIPQTSFDILMFLANNPEFCTAQEISEIRRIKKNLVSVHVEKLVQAGLIRRGSILEDRRKIELACTEKAAPIIKEGKAIQVRFLDEISQGISEGDWLVYKRINEQVAKNAGKILKGNEKRDE